MANKTKMGRLDPNFKRWLKVGAVLNDCTMIEMQRKIAKQPVPKMGKCINFEDFKEKKKKLGSMHRELEKIFDW